MRIVSPVPMAMARDVRRARSGVVSVEVGKWVIWGRFAPVLRGLLLLLRGRFAPTASTGSFGTTGG